MFSQQIEELKETYQEKLESTFEMYKDAIKEHAYQSAMSNLEDDYVPLDDFLAEQQKVEVRSCWLFHLQVRSEDPLTPSSGHDGNYTDQMFLVDLWNEDLQKPPRKTAQLGLLNRNFQRLTIKSALQALKRKVSELETLKGAIPPTMEQSCQTQPSKAPAAEGWQVS